MGFHSLAGTPSSRRMIYFHGKIPIENGWLGVALWLRKPPYRKMKKTGDSTGGRWGFQWCFMGISWWFMMTSSILPSISWCPIDPWHQKGPQSWEQWKLWPKWWSWDEKIESSCWHRIEKKAPFSRAISGRRTKNLGWSNISCCKSLGENLALRKWDVVGGRWGSLIEMIFWIGNLDKTPKKMVGKKWWCKSYASPIKWPTTAIFQAKFFFVDPIHVLSASPTYGAKLVDRKWVFC